MWNRNILMSTLIMLLLALPFLMFATQNIICINLPSWLDAKDATNLSGNKTETNLATTMTLGGFKRGEFQNALEEKIEKYFPAKASILLTNAALQRTAIEQSNIVFNWEWYPTFYGSEIVTNSSDDLLVTPIVNKSGTVAKNLETTASVYNQVASSFPDISFYIGIPSSGESSSFINSLRSNAVDEIFVSKHFFNLLDKSIIPVNLTISNLDDYKKLYFKTDHHWNMDGGYRGYKLIAEKMGFKNILPMGAPISFDVEFYGSQARIGLDTSTGSDNLVDYYFNLPSFNVYEGFEKNKKENPKDFVASTNAYLNNNESNESFVNHYALYYHPDLDFFELDSESKSSSNRVLLIAGDSFSNNMERLFLNHFDKVYSYTLKRYNKDSLNDIIKNLGDVDTVLILQSFNNIAN